MSNYSQRSRRANRGNRTNKILNILIGVVVVLIIITISFIFVDGGDPAEDKASKTESVESDVATEQDESKIEEEGTEEETADLPDESDPAEESGEEQQENTPDEEAGDESETVNLPDESEAVEEPSNDPIVEKTITNPSWQPIGTSQSGPHASSYDQNSVDWAEKEKALSYASGLSQDNMIVWFLGNGGSPQKSIGTISSKDQSEKYRVYLEWVDGEGWKPVKMDVLTTLEGVKK